MNGEPISERSLTLSDFSYPVPDRLVAQVPCAERERARLLIRDRDGTIRHGRVADLSHELADGALLILNDTRVFPSRLAARIETGAEVEVFLVRPTDREQTEWLALAKPMKKLQVGRRLDLAGGLRAHVVEKLPDGSGHAMVRVRFDRGGGALALWIDEHGYVPLPPYIHRDLAATAGHSPDRERYQTVYAQSRGSVAAPTAGLHFSAKLLDDLGNAGVDTASVTLHVGAGTFLPVKTETLAGHVMHGEAYRVPRATVQALLAARRSGRRVVAVGTTSLRCLEDLYRCAGGPERMLDLADTWRTTELFLYPRARSSERFRPWVIDGLFTNFHQPESTLFMLVCALTGLDQAKAAYQVAVEHEYRFFSYGDASLLWL